MSHGPATGQGGPAVTTAEPLPRGGGATGGRGRQTGESVLLPLSNFEFGLIFQTGLLPDYAIITPDYANYAILNRQGFLDS
jgi:hypothetical protein